MRKEDLVGQLVILKDGKEALITAVEGDDMKHFIVHTDAENKIKKLTNRHKIFNLYLACRSEALILLDETLNNEVKEFIKREKELEIKDRQMKEEARKAAIERELFERESKKLLKRSR